MSFLGVAGGPPSEGTDFLQNVDVAIARNIARDVALKSRVYRMRGLGEMGAMPTRGSRAWWIWYATSYLPQYFSQAQIQRYVLSSPYYYQYGSPYTYGSGYQNYGYGYNPYQGYGYNPYQYMNQPYGYNQYGSGYPYYDQYGQAQYTQYQSQQGAYACQQQGGYWDYTQQTCGAPGSQYGGAVVGPSGSPPNVIGMPVSLAVSTLNNAGFNVWELNRDGVSQGVPPGYSANRVDISTASGVVTAAAVG